MEINFVITKAPCQKEIIEQLAEIQQYALICSCPFHSIINSIGFTQECMFQLELENSSPDTVFAIAKSEGSVVGFAQGFRVYADRTPGFLRGNGARMACGDEYFYLNTVVVSWWHQKKGIGKELIERILKTQTCQKALLWTINGSAMFGIIRNMGGEVALVTRPDGCFMTLPIPD